MLRLDGAVVGDGVPGPVARRLFEMLSRRVGGGLNSEPPLR
jgi:D-alanine transaminase